MLRAALFSVLLIAAPVVAQTKPDSATLAAAKALFEQLGGPAQIKGTAERSLADLRTGAMVERTLASQPGFTMARAQRPQVFDAVFQKIGKIQADAAEPVFREAVPAIVNAAIASYATHYSVAELRALSEFYRTPAGQALQRSQAKVSRDINAAFNERIGTKMSSALRLTQPQVAAELKRLQPKKAK